MRKKSFDGPTPEQIEAYMASFRAKAAAALAALPFRAHPNHEDVIAVVEVGILHLLTENPTDMPETAPDEPAT